MDEKTGRREQGGHVHQAGCQNLSPVCPSPGTVRHTCLLGASHPPRPAPSSSEVSQAAPGDATDAGKNMKLSLTFMAPFPLLKCLKL